MARSKPPTRRRPDAKTAAPSVPVREPVPRGERWAIAGVTLLALAVRIAFPERMAVEHFDEGVYVGNFWFGGEGYPFRHLYAPPLVPAVLEWSMVFLGPGRWGTMLPGVLCGTLTVPLAWWVGREWFGRAAGLAAAVLIATSGFHALYSRTALVDVFLAFWMLLAVHAGWRANVVRLLRMRTSALGESGLLRAVAAGVATGLAWWTKYNGWLPLAILLAGAVPWWVAHRKDAPSPLRVLATWGVIAITAFLVWSPVLWGLQPHGGYAAVAANHAQFFGGVSEWWPACAQQVGNQLALNGALTLSGFALALLAPLALRRAGGVDPPANAPVSSAGDSGRTRREGDSHHRPALAGPSPRALAWWLTAAWLIGLTVAIPLYRPYPRLVVPWTLAACLALGGGIGRGWEAIANRRSSPAPWKAIGLVVGGLIVAQAAFVGFRVTGDAIHRDRLAAVVPAWQNRSRLQVVAQPIAEGVGPDAVVFVYAEPALVHHLSSFGIAALPAGHLALERPPGRDAFLVTGPHAARTPAFVEEWERRSDAFELVEEFEYEPSVLVGLNQHSRAELAAGDVERPPIRMYRLR